MFLHAHVLHRYETKEKLFEIYYMLMFGIHLLNQKHGRASRKHLYP
jgi:hypothetical protein